MELNLPPIGRSHAPSTRLWLTAWVLISLLSVVPSYLHYVSEGQTVPWSRLFSEVTGWYLWALLLPLILWAARRFPLGSGSWKLNLPVHFLIGATVAVIYGILVLLKNQAVFLVVTGSSSPHFLSQVSGYLIGGFQFYVVIYGTLVAAVHAVDYYRKFREREVKALELEASLSQAHLQMLKMQLEPHFLFNTLNAISALLHKEPEKADRMVSLLSEFLRTSLRGSGRQEVTLEEEIGILEHYLEIEETRFGERLSVSLDVAPELLEAAVPALMLQPVVENSIRHGLDNGAGSLSVWITARPQGPDRLRLVVADDGPGFPEPVEDAFLRGIGLSNTRARLRRLYGRGQAFELANAESGGARVTATIPRHRLEARNQVALAKELQ